MHHYFSAVVMINTYKIHAAFMVDFGILNQQRLKQNYY